MERPLTEDGPLFVKSLANFIRQHEKALANSLQVSVMKKANATNASSSSISSIPATNTASSSHASSTLAAALSFTGLHFKSHTIKPAHLTLTAHHLFYLLSRMEEMDIPIGLMNVRVENISNDVTPTNYVSFLHQTKAPPARAKGDRESIHSVSSVRSVMSGMSAFWSSIGLGNSVTNKEKAKAAAESDVKYLYSAFTKLPSLRLSNDHRARRIRGYEEFPFDTAVPLFAFKNLQQLDIVDVDFRGFYGWDRLAEQLTLLTVKRANIDDPADLITNVVLDDADKRRKRSAKGGQPSPTMAWAVPSSKGETMSRSHSDPGSTPEASPIPVSTHPDRHDERGITAEKPADNSSQLQAGSVSPGRPSPSRPHSSYRHVRTFSSKAKRSGSGSSNSSDYSVMPHRSESSSNLLSNVLPLNKWHRLKYLSLADNALTQIPPGSLLPLANTLRSLNLSANLFTDIPDELALMIRLNSLDLSNCMIASLRSLERNPLPAILTLKLKSNRLRSLAGIERLRSLEYLNVQDNKISDPLEAARLTGFPNLRRIWVRHNPLARVNRNYRVTIFNLFRNTPGYLEDLIIDDAPPSYSERKELVERVPELDRPVVPILPPTNAPQIVAHTVHISTQASESDPNTAETETSRPQLHTAQTDYSVTSARRRRGNRRRGRIVEISRGDLDVNHDVLVPVLAKSDSDIFAAAVPQISTALPEEPEDAAGQIAGRRASLDGQIAARSLENASSDAIQVKSDQRHSLDTAVNIDDYRLKVEALRKEFGSNWISILGDQAWHGAATHSVAQGETATPMASTPLFRSNSHMITSGGRIST